MSEKIKVTKKEIKPILEASFPDYTGKKFTVEFAEKITFYDLNWDGGTKNEYCAVNFESESKHLPDNFAPWNNPIEGKTVIIPVDVLIVEHSYFCGHDMGIRIYANPVNAPKLLKG
jgi:hypothetical protein